MGSKAMVRASLPGACVVGISKGDQGYEKPQVNVAYHLEFQFYSKAWRKGNLVFSYESCIMEYNVKSYEFKK